MFILALGLVARAAVGPVERLLNMLGEQRACALVYAFAFALNLVLCLVLIPRFGARARRSPRLRGSRRVDAPVLVTRYRLGLHVFVFGRPRRDRRPPERHERRHRDQRAVDCALSRRMAAARRARRVSGAWRALAARALEPNVFYEPAFALPAASVFGQKVGAGLVWSQAHAAARPVPGADRASLGPAAAGADRLDPPVRAARHPAGRSRRGRGRHRRLARSSGAQIEWPALLLLPLVPESGPFATALAAALLRREMPDTGFDRHRRALLVPGDQRAGYVEQAIGAKKRKELRRQRNRLADLGTLKIDAAPTALVGDALGRLSRHRGARLEGPRRDGGRRARGHPSLHRKRGARLAAEARCASTACVSTARRLPRHHPAQRRHGAGPGRSPTTNPSRAPRPACSSCSTSPRRCSPSPHRPGRFLRHRGSSDDRPPVARAPRCRTA